MSDTTISRLEVVMGTGRYLFPISPSLSGCMSINCCCQQSGTSTISANRYRWGRRFIRWFLSRWWVPLDVNGACLRRWRVTEARHPTKIWLPRVRDENQWFFVLVSGVGGGWCCLYYITILNHEVQIASSAFNHRMQISRFKSGFLCVWNTQNIRAYNNRSLPEKQFTFL